MIITIIITIIMMKTMMVMNMVVFRMFIKITYPQRRRSTEHPEHYGCREPDTAKVPHSHNVILQNLVLIVKFLRQKYDRNFETSTIDIIIT